MRKISEQQKQNLHKMPPEKLAHRFLVACRRGYLGIVDYLLTAPDFVPEKSIFDLNEAVITACAHAKLETIEYLCEFAQSHQLAINVAAACHHACLNRRPWVVEYLCHSSALKEYIEDKQINIKTVLDFGLRLGCQLGDLDMVKYLMETSIGGHIADISSQNYHGFKLAASNGHIPVMHYLLNHPKLKLDLHMDEDFAVRWASKEGKIDMVQYLLTSQEIAQHADIHAKQDQVFYWACRNNDLPMLRYLIHDYAIDITPAIEEMLEKYPIAQKLLQWHHMQLVVQPKQGSTKIRKV